MFVISGMNEIQIYTAPDGKTELEVRFEGETVWLTQEQIAAVFGTQRPAITKHLKNVFASGELDEQVVSSILEHTTKHGAIAGKTQIKKVKFYNLDAIISIGYRVNSKQATTFRIWATQTLKNYLIQGYALNEKRLKQVSQNLQKLETVIKQIQNVGNSEELQLTEAKGLLEILGNYTKSFVLLSQFDSQSLKSGKLSENITYEIKYEEAILAISELKKQLIAKKEATNLFGNEKDESFKSSLQTIVQTFGGQYLYPSIEEQAAHLLYFVIKNHSFNDGNKRIGAFLFIWFLEKNKHRFKKSGELKINDNGLTAIALLVAQSNPEEKDIIIQLIVALIADVKEL
jgi:death-on-curing family protein